MKLSEIVSQLGCEVRVGSARLDAEVTSVYVSDLLSDVMANAHEGGLWITLQIHQNVVAVAVMKSLSAILLVNSREPDAETVRKAEDEGIPILVSSLPAFELAGKLFGMGLTAG